MVGISSTEWAAFLECIKTAKAEISSGEAVWFRGQNSFEYYLLPSLLRYQNGLEKEEYLFRNFKKFGDRIFERRQSEWETLFEMQHYWVPTRLLDWSETFAIALFFAAYYNQSASIKNDAAVYLLNPSKLNSYSRINKIYSIPRDESDYSYSEIYWRNKPFAPNAPIAIEPIFINSRMLAQRGVFTVHDNSIDPIEERFPNAIRKVPLPKELVPAALEFLDLSNINEFTVYPDLGGMADFLRKSSGLKHR